MELPIYHLWLVCELVGDLTAIMCLSISPWWNEHLSNKHSNKTPHQLGISGPCSPCCFFFFTATCTYEDHQLKWHPHHDDTCLLLQRKPGRKQPTIGIDRPHPTFTSSGAGVVVVVVSQDPLQRCFSGHQRGAPWRKGKHIEGELKSILHDSGGVLFLGRYHEVSAEYCF